MREIKFRVWNTFLKKYQTLQETARKGDIMPSDNELKVTTNYELILEQYTGLKDKNGTKIYEGDIISHEKYGTLSIWYDNGGYVASDGNDEDGSCFDLELLDEYHNDILHDCLVIGNVHEEGLK